MRKKRVLITGAAGFVGRHLVRYLADRNYCIRAMVRKNSNISFLQDLNIEVIEADLRIKNSLQSALDDTDFVVHLATTMKGPWEEYLESTVKGTQRLLEIAKDSNVKKFIYISSIAVSDISDVNGKFITEDAAYAKEPLSYYERSKIQAEKVVLEFSKEGLPCIIIRSGVIYGPHGKLYPSRLGYSLGQDRFLVIGNGKNKIPLVYIHNLIDAIYLAIESHNSKGEIYNIIDEQVITQEGYLKVIKEKLNPSLSIIRVPCFVAVGVSYMLRLALKMIRKQSPFRKVYLDQCSHQINYSNEKAKRELGWKPKFAPEEAVYQTMNWYRNNTKGLRGVDLKNIRGNIHLKKSLNVGIVGCGWIASIHLSVLKKIKNLNIVALCDTNIESAKKMVKQFGESAIYADFDEMLNKEKIDVVHILTPTQSHKELTIKAAGKGCHILVEKPMAMDTNEAQEMVEAAQKNNVQLCIDHNHLYDPIMIEARKLINRGTLGEIVYVESWYGFNLGANLNSRYMLPGAERHWAMEIPGKLYQNLIPHPLSVLTDVIGYPNEIYAMTSAGGVVKAMKNDELRVMMKCNGKIGLISTSLAVSPRYQFLNIYGTKASIFLDFLNNTLIKHNTPKIIPKPISRAFINLSTAKILTFAIIRNFWKVMTRKFTPYEGTEILIKEFYRSITEDREIPVSAQEGLKSMEIMDKIWSQIKIS